MANSTKSDGQHEVSLPELAGRLVLICARSVPPVIGGEEGQVSRLCNVLVRAGARVEVWTTTAAPALPRGVRTHVRPRLFAAMPLYLGWLCLSVALRRTATAGVPAVLITTKVSGDSALLARISRVLRIAVVIFLTGGQVGGSEFSLQRRPWVKRWIVTGSSAAVAHAEAFLDELKQAGFSGTTTRIGTIVDGLDLGQTCLEQLPTTPGSPALIWCGRNDPVKDLPALFRLFEGRLQGVGAPSLLVVIDEPPENAPAGAVVHLRCPMPRAHMASADVLLVTSRFEGQGAVIAEAAVEGTPCVAYGVGGVPETMGRLDGGAIVPLGASDADYADAVGRVWKRFGDPAERTALAHRASQQFERDPPEAWVQLLTRVSRSRSEEA